MLHIFYRSCSYENDRPRPHFYSKALCLQSCLQALDRVPDASFTLVNNGSIQQDLYKLAKPYAQKIVELPNVSVADSFIALLQETTRCNPSELIYFAEDDYLYLPDALVKLVECYQEISSDYITLFDDPLRYKLSDDVPPDLPLCDHAIYVSQSHHWRCIESTTHTFGGRAQTIWEDTEIFSTHLARRVEDKSYIADRETWRHLQGLGAYKYSGKVRKLVGAIPALATHCEITALSPTIDWSKLATEVASEIPLMSN